MEWPEGYGTGQGGTVTLDRELFDEVLRIAERNASLLRRTVYGVKDVIDNDFATIEAARKAVG